jgi:hypothetical protein
MIKRTGNLFDFTEQCYGLDLKCPKSHMMKALCSVFRIRVWEVKGSWRLSPHQFMNELIHCCIHSLMGCLEVVETLGGGA